MVTHKYSQNSRHKTNIHPALDWTLVHLHTDGVVATSFGNTTVGEVVQDQQGNWILGFNRFLGHCMPFEAELWGILDGVLILLNKGYKKSYNSIR